MLKIINFISYLKFHFKNEQTEIKEAIVKKWHVNEGDMVEEFQEVADVATDKLFTTIPSSFRGKIHKKYVKEEETCLVFYNLMRN